MEMGSSSLTISTSSSSSGSSDSLKGLKFGQKIYFEDVGIGAPAKSGGGSSSAGGCGGVAPPKRVRGGGGGGVVQGTQPPRCQVEGCKVDLTDAKAYYSRHKVCGMHSKSPKVVVNGLEQRFCQQCSRFHQLPEFDQGKRSCRRRLAGHNERRRKPPPGSLLSSRYGRLSSSIFENSTRVGGFLMDFSSYPRLPGRDPRVPGNQPAPTARFHTPHPWQTNPENPPQSDLFLQGSPGVTGFLGVGSDSGCALSLLSNQPTWGSRSRASGLGPSNLVSPDGSTLAQPMSHHGSSPNHFSTNPSWGFRTSEASPGSHVVPPDLGLGQIPSPMTGAFSGQFSGELELGRQYMELDSSRAYDTTTQHVHWSL